ncbi:hypothetical protein CKAH01_12575 [Colletotrichum kahawae]|uniref:Uncharacterized protein n=1 Tax=Colletotrichum kahawae TaxID=34407 RepID=A0AAD9YS27_COLKA|nr:hypothetical protein CKAH01_12575 [Colletotrichum kahawae]
MSLSSTEEKTPPLSAPATLFRLRSPAMARAEVVAGVQDVAYGAKGVADANNAASNHQLAECFSQVHRGTTSVARFYGEHLGSYNCNCNCNCNWNCNAPNGQRVSPSADKVTRNNGGDHGSAAGRPLRDPSLPCA